MVDRVLLCWDCHEPISEINAVRVRPNPSVPPSVVRGSTLVCKLCAAWRDSGES